MTENKITGTGKTMVETAAYEVQAVEGMKEESGG